MVERRILVLDDNEGFCQFLSDFFEKMKVKGEFFIDLRSFYRAVNHHPDSILLIDYDFKSPRGGLDVIEHIRDLISTDIIIFALANHNKKSTIEESLDTGANDFVYKPLDKLVLISKLCTYLNIEVKEEWELFDIVVPFLRSEPIKLSFDIKMTEIDERGIRFESENFIVPGTVLHVNSHKVREILRLTKPVLLTVSESIKNSSTDRYDTYGKFSIDNSKLASAVRAWVAIQKSKLA